MIKPAKPTSMYPLGGLRVVVTAWKGGKREQTVDYRLYLDKNTGKIDKRSAQDEAELLEKQIEKELKIERDTKKENSPSGILRTFKDYAEHYQATSSTQKNPMINQMKDAFGGKSPDQWPSSFEEFIKKQDGRKRQVHKWIYEEINGKKIPVRKELVDTDTTISLATIKCYRRYFKAICGYAISEKIPSVDRLNKNYGSAFKVGKTESRGGFPTDIQRKKAMEYIGNEYEFFLPAFQFACQMPIRPEDQFATMYPIDKDDKVWKEAPQHHWKAFGLTVDKINQLTKQIRYLPKKTWKTEKYATPLILPNVEKYVYGRIGDDECNTVFYAPGKCFRNGDPGKKYPITSVLYRTIWDKVRDYAKFDLEYYVFTRHDAVSFLRLHNVPDPAIMQYAGWSTRQILDGYDSQNTDRLTRTTYDLLAGAVQKETYTQESIRNLTAQ